jgi:hypothetical protein
MNYFMVMSGESGTRIRGPMSAEQVSAEMAQHKDDTGRDRPVLSEVPPSDKGYWYGVPDAAVLILRGEIVSFADVTRCPCGSGKAFAECHGADVEDAAPWHATCEHDKVYGDHILTSNPPKYPWICRKCKARGNDIGAGTGERGEYEKVLRAANAGTGPCGDRILRATGAD